MATLKVSEEIFACHSAACRPPGSGGTGGSSKAGKAFNKSVRDYANKNRDSSGKIVLPKTRRKLKAGHGMGDAQGGLGKAKYVRKDGTPVSKDYPGAKKVGSRTIKTKDQLEMIYGRGNIPAHLLK